MPFFQKHKNKFINHHYQKSQLHPQQFQSIIDPNLISLLQWVIYVGRWIPGQIGSYSRLAQVVWQVYKRFYENKPMQELFGIAITGMNKSRTKRFILRKFFNSFSHVFSSPLELSKKPEFKYLGKPKQEQLLQIEAHQAQIKNYILSQIAQKYGNKVAEKVQSKYGDNFSEIILSAIIAMTVDQQQKVLKSKKKGKKYILF